MILTQGDDKNKIIVAHDLFLYFPLHGSQLNIRPHNLASSPALVTT